jgi:SDR family mycofactocin-dependent oxidoreductase
MKRLEGRVAFVTGAARGTGRSLCVSMAREGADIIALDLCQQVESVSYILASTDDLDVTAELVQNEGRRIFKGAADVRDYDAVAQVLKEGEAELGPVNIVVPNAAILPVLGEGSDTFDAWRDSLDVNLTGVWNTIRASIPGMIEQGSGGSIVAINSTGGLKGLVTNLSAGSLGYVASKHGVVGLVRAYATELGKYGIRVNSVHPTGVNTPMVVNQVFDDYFAENPIDLAHALPVVLIDSVDISNAVIFLSSDEGRYITGVTLAVDAGFTVV